MKMIMKIGKTVIILNSAVLKSFRIFVLMGFILMIFSSFSCKKTSSLFPIVVEPMPSILENPNQSEDTIPHHDPRFLTDWGDTIRVPSIPAGEFLISDYGALTGGKDNAASIQKAIEAAAGAGGGTVIIPAGTFISGPLKLKSNIGLKLSEGAILKVIAYEKYPGAGTTAKVPSFLDLSGTANVLISGTGMIEGQGQDWWTVFRATKPTGGIARPAIISFDDAHIIEVEGITIRNAPNGHISIHRNNQHVTVSGVTLNSPENSPNTDGIDVWSPNVNILNCNISCGDDNIAMDNESRYITIKDCIFGRGHGLSIGSYTSGIDHIYVTNCVFDKTDNGVHIKSSRDRSGVVENLVYENLSMTGVSIPINICEYYPDKTIPKTGGADKPQPITNLTPQWKHIFMKNITAIDSDRAGLLWSVPEMHMKDIVFNNVQIEAKTGMIINNVDDCAFIGGSKITVETGRAISSSYDSKISGIDLSMGVPIK